MNFQLSYLIYPSRQLMNPRLPMALRLQAILLHGLCVIYKQQLAHLLGDTESLWRRVSSPSNTVLITLRTQDLTAPVRSLVSNTAPARNTFHDLDLPLFGPSLPPLPFPSGGFLPFPPLLITGLGSLPEPDELAIFDWPEESPEEQLLRGNDVEVFQPSPEQARHTAPTHAPPRLGMEDDLLDGAGLDEHELSGDHRPRLPSDKLEQIPLDLEQALLPEDAAAAPADLGELPELDFTSMGANQDSVHPLRLLSLLRLLLVLLLLLLIRLLYVHSEFNPSSRRTSALTSLTRWASTTRAASSPPPTRSCLSPSLSRLPWSAFVLPAAPSRSSTLASPWTLATSRLLSTTPPLSSAVSAIEWPTRLRRFSSFVCFSSFPLLPSSPHSIMTSSSPLPGLGAPILLPPSQRFGRPCPR